MEIKAQLLKPYTEEQRIEFIVEQNHRNGYEIVETETSLDAMGYTEEEKAEQEKERISNLEITQEKFWNFMLPVTKQMAIDKIKDFPEIGKKMLIEIDNPTYKRSSIIVDAIAGLYNIEDETLDNLFQS